MVRDGDDKRFVKELWRIMSDDVAEVRLGSRPVSVSDV